MVLTYFPIRFIWLIIERAAFNKTEASIRVSGHSCAKGMREGPRFEENGSKTKVADRARDAGLLRKMEAPFRLTRTKALSDCCGVHYAIFPPTLFLFPPRLVRWRSGPFDAGPFPRVARGGIALNGIRLFHPVF